MSHVQREICQNFALGFCPDGPYCSKQHVKSLVPPTQISLAKLANFPVDFDWPPE